MICTVIEVKTLFECGSRPPGPGSHNCGHSEDASVECLSRSTIFLSEYNCYVIYCYKSCSIYTECPSNRLTSGEDELVPWCQDCADGNIRLVVLQDGMRAE